MIINKAVILAGGKGTRAQIKKHMHVSPKVMFRINDKPILQKNIEILRDQLNIKSIILVVGFQEQLVRNYFNDGKEFGIDIEYIESDPSNGIADALLLIKEKVKGVFIVMLGDEFYFNSTHYTIKEENYDGMDSEIENGSEHEAEENIGIY